MKFANKTLTIPITYVLEGSWHWKQLLRKLSGKETTHEATAINQALTDDGLDESHSREVVKNGQIQKNSVSRSNNFLKNELMKYYPIIN